MHAPRGTSAAAILLLVRVAAAEQDRPFRLAYDAPAGCPSATEVAARVQAITTRARPAKADEPGYDAIVNVGTSDAGFLASISVRLPDGTETGRTVPAPTCNEAVDAAVLIVAITIDPEAAALESARPGAEAAKTAESPSKPATRAPPTEAEPSPPIAAAPARRDEIGGSDLRERFLVEAGTGFVALAIAPGLSPDFAAGVAYEPTFGKEALRFALSLHVAPNTSIDAPGGRARFGRLAGRLDACPFRLGSDTANVRPCVLFEMGPYWAEGYDTVDGQNQPVLWSAPGAFVSGELRASGHWGARLDAGALFPLRRDEFYFEPGHRNVHEIPAVGFFAAVSVALTIL